MTTSLKRANIEWRDKSLGVLGCLNCGKGWGVMLRTGGRLPRGWWKCPNGCNADLYSQVRS